MLRTLALIALAFMTANTAKATTLFVNCDNGQSLNRTLSRLERHEPATVWVKGTCSEYVQVKGFDGLTLQGLSGAALVQPGTNPHPALFGAVLQIESSRSVTVEGFTVRSPVTGVFGIAIEHGSTDIRLRDLTVEGGPYGIIIFERSQVSLARVTGRDPGYTPVGIYDESDVHVESCLFENTSGATWHAGFDVGSSHLTMQGTTIRNMQVGINADDGSSVDTQGFNTYYPAGGPIDVLIESPLGVNYYGVSLSNGSSMNVGTALLHITGAGQVWGGNTGGILLSGASSLNAGNNIVISGSQGQGIMATDNSHVALDGAQITGSQHGGLVATNLSTISVGSLTPPTVVSGNVTDLFCDSRSLITGAAQIANAASVQCSNLIAGDNDSLP